MRLLTVPEVAKLWKVGTTTLYQMCERGELPTIMLGRTIRIPEEALQEWVRLHTKRPSPPMQLLAPEQWIEREEKTS